MWLYEKIIMAIVKRPKQLNLIEDLYASPGEFFYEDGSPFEGEYHMYDKSKPYYFEGGKWNRKPVPIVPFQKTEFNDPMSIDYTEANDMRDKPDYEKKTIKSPRAMPPMITSAEIDKGEITRFLCLQNNTGRVFEIDEDQHKAYDKGGNPYNANYTLAKMSWFITGPLFTKYSLAGIPLIEGIYERNYQQRALILDTIPKFSPILSNLLEYTLPDPEDDLYSDGSFLYLPNGQKYVGKYHIHPAKGPMVGSTHTTATHSKLKILI